MRFLHRLTNNKYTQTHNIIKYKDIPDDMYICAHTHKTYARADVQPPEQVWQQTQVHVHHYEEGHDSYNQLLILFWSSHGLRPTSLYRASLVCCERIPKVIINKNIYLNSVSNDKHGLIVFKKRVSCTLSTGMEIDGEFLYIDISPQDNHRKSTFTHAIISWGDVRGRNRTGRKNETISDNS